MTRSQDKGLTWTVATNLTAQCQRPFLFNTHDPLSSRADSASNGGGIQLRDGRLLIGMSGGPSATTCFSDDHGKHWQAAPFKNSTDARGEPIRYNTGDTAAEDEVKIAELADGSLYMTIRNDDVHSTGYACSNTSAGHHNVTYNCDGHRQFALSTELRADVDRQVERRRAGPGMRGRRRRRPRTRPRPQQRAGPVDFCVLHSPRQSNHLHLPGRWQTRHVGVQAENPQSLGLLDAADDGQRPDRRPVRGGGPQSCDC